MRIKRQRGQLGLFRYQKVCPKMPESNPTNQRRPIVSLSYPSSYESPTTHRPHPLRFRGTFEHCPALTISPLKVLAFFSCSFKRPAQRIQFLHLSRYQLRNHIPSKCVESSPVISTSLTYPLALSSIFLVAAPQRFCMLGGKGRNHG